MTHWYTSLRVRSFCCPSAIFSGVTCLKMETAFTVLTISFLSSSSIIDCTAQLMFCASCLRSSGILYQWGTNLQPHRLTNIKLLWLHYYQSHSCSWCHIGDWMDGGLVPLWPCWNGPFGTCWQNWKKNTSKISHQICNAPNLLSQT